MMHLKINFFKYILGTFYAKRYLYIIFKKFNNNLNLILNFIRYL